MIERDKSADDKYINEVIYFEPFRLFVAERYLEKAGCRVRLKTQSLDILIVLVEHAGQFVTQKDLIAQVWPDAPVDERHFRFYMTALRKALADKESGLNYLKTLPGRGYSFVR